ncbi:hypothetical protein FRC17_003355 [Serendipita sp. 399]|nr:hypothetical protein FRC17_003355 [Serendipita sp. 399]
MTRRSTDTNTMDVCISFGLEHSPPDIRAAEIVWLNTEDGKGPLAKSGQPHRFCVSLIIEGDDGTKTISRSTFVPRDNQDEKVENVLEELQREAVDREIFAEIINNVPGLILAPAWVREQTVSVEISRNVTLRLELVGEIGYFIDFNCNWLIIMQIPEADLEPSPLPGSDPVSNAICDAIYYSMRLILLRLHAYNVEFYHPSNKGKSFALERPRPLAGVVELVLYYMFVRKVEDHLNALVEGLQKVGVEMFLRVNRLGETAGELVSLLAASYSTEEQKKKTIGGEVLLRIANLQTLRFTMQAPALLTAILGQSVSVVHSMGQFDELLRHEVTRCVLQRIYDLGRKETQGQVKENWFMDVVAGTCFSSWESTTVQFQVSYGSNWSLQCSAESWKGKVTTHRQFPSGNELIFEWAANIIIEAFDIYRNVWQSPRGVLGEIQEAQHNPYNSDTYSPSSLNYSDVTPEEKDFPRAAPGLYLKASIAKIRLTVGLLFPWLDPYIWVLGKQRGDRYILIVRPGCHPGDRVAWALRNQHISRDFKLKDMKVFDLVLDRVSHPHGFSSPKSFLQPSVRVGSRQAQVRFSSFGIPSRREGVDVAPAPFLSPTTSDKYIQPKLHIPSQSSIPPRIRDKYRSGQETREFDSDSEWGVVSDADIPMAGDEADAENLSSDLAPYTILIVGETGVGKSSVLELIANVIAGNDIDHYDFGILDHTNEQGGSGKGSQTNEARFYQFKSRNGVTVRILDTPGLADTRGLDHDELHKKSIATTIQRYIDSVNAVLILANGTVPRVTVGTDYALSTLCAIFPKALAQNIAFLFTNVSTPLAWNFAQDTLPDVLKEAPQFLLDNPISLQKKYLERKDDPKMKKMKASMRETVKISEQKALGTIAEVFDWRSQNIEAKISDTLAHMEQASDRKMQIARLMRAVEKGSNDMNVFSNFENTVNMPIWKQQNTTEHNILCTQTACYTKCHENCSLGFSMKSEDLTNCVSMENRTCRVCKHSLDDHRHFRYKWAEEVDTQVSVDEDMKRNWENAKDTKERSEALIRGTKKILDQYNRSIDRGTKDLAQLADDYAKLSLSGSFGSQLEKAIALLQQKYESMENQGVSEDQLQTVKTSIDTLMKKLQLLKDAKLQERKERKENSYVGKGRWFVRWN